MCVWEKRHASQAHSGLWSIGAGGCQVLILAQMLQSACLRNCGPGDSVMSIRGMQRPASSRVGLNNRMGVNLDGLHFARAAGLSFELADIAHRSASRASALPFVFNRKQGPTQ